MQKTEMDCKYSTSYPLVTENDSQAFCSNTRRQSKENPLKRKRMNTFYEEPELKPKETPGKRRRTETEGNDVNREETKNDSQTSCFSAGRQSNKNHLKRKRMDDSPEEPELQSEETPGKRRRTEKEEDDVNREETKNDSQASCSNTRRQSKENPLKRKRMNTFHKEPELEPEETPGKRRRTETEGDNMNREKTKNDSQTSCFSAGRQSKENHLKRKRMDDSPEELELQSEEIPRERSKTEKEVNNMNLEKTSFETSHTQQEPTMKIKSMDESHEEPELQSEEKQKKWSRKETEEKGKQTVRRVNPFRTVRIYTHYIVNGLLGKGSFGTVYSAVRKTDGRKVAIKFADKDEDERFVTLPGDTRRIPVEVALMQLACKPPHCPNVVQLIEWFETAQYFILVMERPDPCVDLYKYCNKNRLNDIEAQILMAQVAVAASHCLNRGVFHRDIKEENIVVNPDTLEVKLIDFGCGDLLQESYSEYIGTPYFVPPEVLSGYYYQAEAATTWGLGVLLYSLLCGTVPYIDKTEVLEGDLYLPDDLSEASARLIKWCLQQDPNDRPTLYQFLTHDWF